MTNGWAVVAALAGWSVIVYFIGYFMAKHYWYERGHFDGLDDADRYVKSRMRVQSSSVPRLGGSSRE